MGLISRKTAGLLLLFGLGSILVFNLLFIKPFFFWLAILAGLCLTIIFLHQPPWGMSLFLAARVWLDNWGEKNSLKITENFSLGMNALLGILVSSLLAFFLIKNRADWKEIPFKKIWLAILLVAATSLFFTIDLGWTWRELARLLSIFLFFSSAAVIFQKEVTFSQVSTPLFLSAILPFAAALGQMIGQTGLGGTLGLDGRLFGTFSHPNTFAAFVLIVIAAAWLRFREESAPLKKKYWLALLALSLFLLLETFSRGAWLAFLVFLMVLSLFQSPKILWVSFLLFLAAFSFSEDFRFRLQDVYNPSATGSIQWRVQQWEKGWDSWKEKFWTGWGAGTETMVFEKQYGFYSGNPYTHNDFLRMGIELGIIGLAVYTGLVATVFFRLFSDYWKARRPEEKTAAIFGLALLTALSFFSLTSNLFRATAVQWSFWFLLAGLLFLKKEKPLIKK